MVDVSLNPYQPTEFTPTSPPTDTTSWLGVSIYIFAMTFCAVVVLYSSVALFAGGSVIGLGGVLGGVAMIVFVARRMYRHVRAKRRMDRHSASITEQ